MTRWIVIEVEDTYSDNEELGPIPLNLCRWLQTREVQFMVLSRENNPNEVVIECVPTGEAERSRATLLKHGYTGPLPSYSVHLFEGQVIEIRMLGNITAFFGPSQLQMTFHSQRYNRTHMQVKGLADKKRTGLDGRGWVAFFALPRVTVIKDKEKERKLRNVRKKLKNLSSDGDAHLSGPQLLCKLPVYVPMAGQTRGKNAGGQKTFGELSSIAFELHGPKMAMVYTEACRQGSLPVHSTRSQVVGQFRSGKTCFINRLMDEPFKEDAPITDGIQITSDVQTKTWKKPREEIDEFGAGMAGLLLQSQQETEDSPHDTDISSEHGDESDEVVETPWSQREDVSEAQKETSAGDVTGTQGTAGTSQPFTIPNSVVKSVKRIRDAGFTEEELGTADHPRLSFWDFGGQATYYGTHHCFITHRGVYILVMSLLQKLSDPVPDLDYMASVDNLRTGGDYLDHWLNSVRSHTLHQPMEHGEKLQNTLPEAIQSSSQDSTSASYRPRRPPVIIVLTHKDKVSQEYIEEYKREIWSHIDGKATEGLVMSKIFAVDNTSKDASIDEIRDYIREVARGLPHMGKEIPIPWLHLTSKLKTKRNEGGPFCKFQEIAELARDPDINITDEQTLALVLTFLHDRGDVIFFDEPSLRDDVTLQPQVMIDVFKTIITVPEYQQDRQVDPEARRMWERLEQKGVLSDNLLTGIWGKKDRQLEKPFLLQHKSFLKALMEKFYLICNATPVGDVSDGAQQEEIYFVPALLSCERDNAVLHPGNMYICPQSLYFVFSATSEKFLPSGMFSRLQALCVRRFGLQESCVFAGCARFPTDNEEQVFVITKVSHYLKVELLSSSNVFTEGLRVRKFLSSALFEIKESWIPCIQYDLCYSTQDEGEPVFRSLPTEHWSQEQLSGIPSVFRAVWMSDGLQYNRTVNSGGEGPEILHPTGDLFEMRTIGPVLDTMEQGGGLTLEQCDHIRNQLTPIQRFLDMKRQGEPDSYLLGASVEMCLPEFVDLFWREKRGKDIVILHADDYTAQFVLPLKVAANESGLPCHTEALTSTDSITEKTVKLLLNTNNRTVVLVITPLTLQDKHWSKLGYEFSVRNERLVLPILSYPLHEENKERMLQALQKKAPALFNIDRVEVQMDGNEVSEKKLQECIQRAMTDEEKEFQLILNRIFSHLDDTDVRILLRVWSARTGQQETAEIKGPQDLMRAMVKSGYITAGDLGTLEKDMIVAGISFPAIIRDISGVPDELQYGKTTEATVGPMGGLVEISGFVRLAVPQGVLQRETMITISIVDIPGVLKSSEAVNWTSGYPWSLGKDACPREVLDQVLFSPAVDIKLHGARMSGPMELQTRRPPGSEGMVCILLKHHDGEGWKDITASTLHHVDSEKLSVCLPTLCRLAFLWTTLDKATSVAKVVLDALSPRTLKCRFAAYIKPYEENVDFHVVCWDQSVKTNEDQYQPSFTKCCISQAAMFDLSHGDKLEVAANVSKGQTVSQPMILDSMQCRDDNGQRLQMQLERPNQKPMRGNVVINSIQERVCEFTFREKGKGKSWEHAKEPSVAADDIDSGVSETGVDLEAIEPAGDSGGIKSSSRKRPRSSPTPPDPKKKRNKKQRGPKRLQAEHGAGPGGARKDSGARDVIRYLIFIKNRVADHWKDLGHMLGFSWPDIQNIDGRNKDYTSRCQDMLGEWQSRNGDAATMDVLMKALEDAQLTSVVDELKDKYPEIKQHLKGLQDPSLGAKVPGAPRDELDVLEWLLTKVKVSHDAYEDNYNRLESHVSELGLTFRAEVPGDGNCMFHAVSDQLLRTEGRHIGHLQLREQVVCHLMRNPHNARGDHIRSFLSNQSWKEYLDTMSRPGTWGDHIILQAMADFLGHDVTIVSSIEADNYVTTLHPQSGPTSESARPLLLGHYAENHYASLDELDQSNGAPPPDVQN